MKLYYGTAEPENIIGLERLFIDKNLPFDYDFLDFGYGRYFYTDLEEAKKIAIIKSKRITNSNPYLVIYNFNEDILNNNLQARFFKSANKNWLDFILKNRDGKGEERFHSRYDITIGAFPDNLVFAVINMLELGFLDKDKILKNLEKWKYSEQFCFHTEKSLHYLNYTDSYLIDEKKSNLDKQIINQNNLHLLLSHKIGKICAKLSEDGNPREENQILITNIEKFYNSNFSKLLHQEDTKLWRESWVVLFDMYQIDRGIKKF